MSGAPVPPARPAEPPCELLDSIALTEAVSADDVEGVAAILKHADLRECAKILDSMVARELVSYATLGEAFRLLQRLAAELQADPSPGGTVLTLSQALGLRWCLDCVRDGSFRDWALSVNGHRVD